MAGRLAEFMREQLSAAWSDEAFLAGAEQATSKSLLKELSVEDGGESRWTFSEPVIHRSAATLSYLASTLSIEEEGGYWRGNGMHGQDDARQDDALRLARLWESLARLGEETPRGHALLNAACAYEIAGYQANAACLARRFDKEPAVENGDLWRIASMFLQRKFVRLGAECAPLAREPDYDKVDDLPYALGLAASALSLSRMGEFFLTGDRSRMLDASTGLARAEEVFAASGHGREFALARGLRALAAPMAPRSTWAVLGDLAGRHFAWRRYLMLLARGLGPSPRSSRSISEVWPSQRAAVEKGLLGSSASKIVRMPTSSGRTRIAEMCMLQALAASPGAPARCVYVAPYRALVAEVAGEMSRVFPDLGFTVSGLDGAYDGDPSEEGEGGDPLADILVVTPEKLDLLLRVRPGSLDGTGLFVIDEGHVVGDAGRGLKMELLLTRLRRRSPSARLILLSAMISDDAMRDLAAWLCGQSGEGSEGEAVIATGWRPTLQRHARFEWSRGAGQAECMLTYEGGQDGLPRRTLGVKDVIRRKTYEHTNPRTGRVVRPTFPSHEKSETAAELALWYAQLGPALVYAVAKKSAAAVAKKILRRIELAEAAGASVPEAFRLRGRRQGEVMRSLRAAREWFGDDHYVTRCLERGIAVHHGGLPGIVRHSVEEDARSGEYAAIVATNTLSQGVNMPIRTVIVHSCRRYDEAGRSERIPASEYWNLGGRAGRAGYETEGTVVHIVSSSLDMVDYDHYREERGSLGGVDSRLYALFGGLAEGRISPGAVDGVIDSEVLGMLAEEGLEGSCEDMVGEVVSGTLAAARANGSDADGGLDMGRMRERFKQVARSASELGGERVKAYGSTGLGREGCEPGRDWRTARAVSLRQHGAWPGGMRGPEVVRVQEQGQARGRPGIRVGH